MSENALSLSNIETKNKFRSLYLEGKEIKEILAEMKIPKGTWDSAYYLNTHALRDFVMDCKREYLTKEAERLSNEVRSVDIMNGGKKVDPKILAIKQKEAEFLRETLSKDLYSKRIEQTGKDGATPMPIINITANVQKEEKQEVAKQSHIIDIEP